MKPPKNFYSNLDRRKQGLPEVPEASAADAGKIIKVGEDGSYELEIVSVAVTGILVAGETSITLTDDLITTNSKFDFYTSIFGVNPLSVTVLPGSITLVFDEQTVNMTVEVEVR